MKRIIRVECWADNYFFGKLLADNSLIRKEKNKAEVLKSIKVRSKGIFSIGIVDNDNDAIEPFLKGFEIEERFFVCEEIEIIKIKDYSYYILQLYPKEFERWIVKYIEVNCGKRLKDFGYNSYKDFETDTKVIYDRLNKNERFLDLMNYVLNNCDKTENHVRKIKKVLKYLIEYTYEVDINELKNV